MGVWGTSIFSNDTACDMRDYYIELLEDGATDDTATATVLTQYQSYFADPEQATTLIIALALTQSRVGRLAPAIRDRALAAIDGGADLQLWANQSPKDLAKRTMALAKARAKIIGPQAARKRLKPPLRRTCGLSIGDVLALPLPTGPVLFRTVHIKTKRSWETPLLQQLRFDGPSIPPLEVIQNLPAANREDLFSDGSSFYAMLDPKSGGWQQANLLLVANIPPRPGDEHLLDSNDYLFWDSLPKLYADRHTGA